MIFQYMDKDFFSILYLVTPWILLPPPPVGTENERFKLAQLLHPLLIK